MRPIPANQMVKIQLNMKNLRISIGSVPFSITILKHIYLNKLQSSRVSGIHP